MDDESGGSPRDTDFDSPNEESESTADNSRAGGGDSVTDDPFEAATAGETTAAPRRAFWAEAVADTIEAADPPEPIVIKGGVSPSGVAHLGNFNEIIRGYFVAAVLRDRGYEVRQVFTADDRDPLRKLPRTLADRDGTLVDLGDVDAGALGRNLGKPYTAIPDPFGEADSYAAHFTTLLQTDAERLDIPVEMISTTELYESGAFDDIVDRILSDQDTAREVIGKYQDKVDDSYVPFNPICANCGKITETVSDVDVESGTVTYECTDLEVGDTVIDGCGHAGTAAYRDGKLPWRFEWPAQWEVLGVDFEPFGKDHAEGSWPSGEDIARNVLGTDPPVPMVYEWFTLDGEALSSSAGNIVTVSEMLELLEPAVLRYFFALDPSKARNLDISRLDQLVDDFDRFERAYFGDVDDEELTRIAERAYPYVLGPNTEPDPDRVRLPYTFAAVLGMVDDPAFREQLARDEGHFTDDTPDWAIEDALERVEKARTWAEQLDNEYNYRLQADLPDVSVKEPTAAALEELAAFVEDGHSGEEIQGEIYEIARRHDIDIADFFETGYRLFFDETQGPRLGEFLGELERDFVVDRLRRKG